MPVFRVYVEKKPGFDIKAGALLRELRDIFGISCLSRVRIFNRYDAENIDEGFLREAVNTVFSEPQTDNVLYDLPDDSDYMLGVEYLPGQFDQRADSCAQCLQLLSSGKRPGVRSACIYLFYCTDGNALQDEDISTIRRHLINPVECMEASSELPDTLESEYQQPEAVEVIDGFTALSSFELEKLCKQYELAMDRDDLAFCRDYFKCEGRDPTITELRMIDTYWSDHCRHTTFLTNLTDIDIESDYTRRAYERLLLTREELGREDIPLTLMEAATIGCRALMKSGVINPPDISDEINACSVKIQVDEDGRLNDWLLMFKNETHNHPTEIEPFGGAATCIGGAIRDPLSGRSYVYQAMRVTGSGDPTVPVSETHTGKLPQRIITTKAAHGYSSYGNQIGLATGLVREIYHPGYTAKRMETGAVIGAVPLSNIKREQPAAGDVVILLGGRTGRDGCGGATGSSKSHDVQSINKCGAEVQKGNAPEERKIQRLFRDRNVTQLIKRCNDFGAGGVSVAVGELADGLEINLDAVPKKYNGLDGTELAISESQERMAVVVSAADADSFIALASKENLEATVIAEVTDNNRLVMRFGGKKIVDISREFLSTNGAPKHAVANIRQLPSIRYSVCTMCGAADIESGGSSENISEIKRFYKLLISDLNVCSQKGLIEQFDSTIGAGTVLMPLGGKYQITPAQAMAAKIPVKDKNTNTCSLMTYAYYPEASQINPYAAAYIAVASSVAKITAAGGSRLNCWLSFQEYFERLGNNPLRWGKPLSALLGAFEAQLDLEVAAIGGKDSMSGSFETLDVPPTLISFAVSVTKADKVISGEFKAAGSDVWLLTPEYRDDGVPVAESMKQVLSETETLISQGLAAAAYVIEAGGVGEAIFKMSAGNRIGFVFDEPFSDIMTLAKHYIGSIILEIKKPESGACTMPDIATGQLLGRTCEQYYIVIDGEKIDCNELQEIYEHRLEPVFPTKTADEPEDACLSIDLPAGGGFASSGSRIGERVAVMKEKPRVLIPVFPGTNCEYDTEKAFNKGGAASEILVIRNLTPNDIEQSINALEEAIGRSHIVALPGGFSGGDEPDGSGKFIVALFKNVRIRDAIHKLLYSRDGLMCGICNGFQALIKLGLVPHGEIIDSDENSATLTFNKIGRHQSRLVNTRVASNFSPWLSNFKAGDIHTVAVSHGEGRFTAPPDLIDSLIANGQVATQYADNDGNPSMDINFNPNGSVFAIEGITSKDGRVFGKMGHSERSGDGLMLNVPGDKNQDIFSAAVKYYLC